MVVEDGAHAGRRPGGAAPAIPGGDAEGTAAVTCFSFYANKTITTGEGGMAVTNNALAERMKLMSLHGLSRDAWDRYSGAEAGITESSRPDSYNMTDIAAAIGVHQLARAEEMRRKRERIAATYRDAFSGGRDRAAR